MSMDNIIAADLGNSRIKLLTGDNLVSYEYIENWIKRVDNFLPDGTKVFYSSVNREREEELLSSPDITEDAIFINVKPMLEKEKIIKYRHIEGVGTDRVLGLVGALAMGKSPLITVDCGTAVTLDALNDENEGIVGSIFPGAETQLRSLLNSSEEIKKLYKTSEKNIFKNAAFDKPAGKNTVEAVQNGIMHSVAGGVFSVIQKIKENHTENDEIRIFTTGGYGKAVSEALRSMGLDARHVQSLVLEGILKIAGNNK